MKGVSEVIAIILILMITIALAATAYTFMSATMSDTTAAASASVSTTTSSMLTSFIIESADANYIYVRNIGQSTLTNLSVYVNDEMVNFAQGPVEPGDVESISLGQVAMKGDSVKVTSSNGFSANKVLSTDCYGSVAYWKLDENGGSTAHDSSPYGNAGNLTNGPTWTNGRFGNGLLFDGVNDYVNVLIPSFLSDQQGAITCWIKFASISQSLYGIPFAISDGAQKDEAYIYVESARGISFTVSQTGTGLVKVKTANLVITDTNWHFLVVQSNGTSITLYIDGIQTALTTQAGTNSGQWFYNATNANMSTIGTLKRASLTATFNGTIDDVAIWNRSLTTTEIDRLYNRAIY